MKKILVLVNFIVLHISLGFAQTNFTLRKDGTILKDGTTFFPMGFYVNRASIDSYKTQISNLAKSKIFNVIDLPYVGGDKPAWTSFLDLCLSKNIYVESQLYYDEPVFEPVDLYKSHKATFAWSIVDDADNGYFSIEQLKDRNTKCKAKDPNHLTFLTLTGYYLGRRNLADNYTNIADASGYQCYPINPPSDYDVTSSNALAETYLRTLLYVKSAAKNNKPMIMNAQNFSWGSQSPSLRFPTVAEVRNMTYSGLAAGVKGIISYVYSNELVNQAELWNEIILLGKDVQEIKNYLLDGELTQKTSINAELVSSYWELADTCFVVLINTTYNKNKTVNLAIPSKYSNHQLISISTRFPVSIINNSGTLSGTLNNQEVQAFKLIPNQPSANQNKLQKTIHTLYPNPARTELFITGNISENTNYEITNMEGKSLQKGEISMGRILIENLKTGIYFIHIKTNSGERVQHFLKD